MGMRVYFARPRLSADDIQSVINSLHSHELTNAGNVRAFEWAFAEFCGGGIASAVSSCMAALHLCAMARLEPGDEVIVPALSHPATALAISLVGAKPVFVDVERHSGNISVDALKAALTPNTKAISVLHYLGRPADMTAIMAVARPRNLFVVEDCALALGSYYQDKHVGLWGDAGCFSFYPVKHITTGEGGMVLTKHPKLADAIIRKRHFGQRHEPGLGLLQAVPDFVELGLNYRMSEMQGALGVSQMRALPEFLEKRERNWIDLSDRLADFEQIHNGGYSHYAFAVFVPGNRDEVRLEMKRRNVGTSVYYNAPIPHITYYAADHKKGQFPNAEAICAETIALPVGPHISARAIAYIEEVLRSAL